MDYTQKLLVGEQTLRKRLAVARFGDNREVEQSPFGQKRQVNIVGPGINVHHEELQPDSQEPSSSFTPRLIDALARTKRFTIIERKDINSILREVSFGETKWVNKDQSAKVGKILGAQVIVTGSIERNQDTESVRESPWVLFLRMYDVETSRIVGTARAPGRTETEMIDRAVSEIISTMDRVPWIGKIASISGQKVYLNAGIIDNVKVGDRFNLFSLGKAIQDPDSKEIIGYEEEPAGKAEVVTAGERVSTLKLTEEKRTIRVGDKAQPSQD
jgi:hypothetical protein